MAVITSIATTVATAIANSLPYIAVGTALAGVATSVATGTVGAVQQHNQAVANAKAQEEQMNYNKRLEEREAARVESENAENAKRQRLLAAQMRSQQTALLGKSGAAMTSGSPLAILGQTAADQEMIVQDAHTRGAIEADKHREQAKMFGYQAGVARMSAPSNAMLGANIAGTWGQGLTTMGQTGITAYGVMKK